MFYRIFRAFLILCLRIMYRRIEAPGLARVPPHGGVLLVANHGNALMDPLLLLVLLSRPITFLAKHTLFPMPLVGFFLKRIGGLPVYRRHEAPGESAKNEETLDRCGSTLSAGGIVCLFPEGISHNEPKLQTLRTGAARIYCRAMRRVSAGLTLLPAGINYESKRAFRSRVLVVFGRPIAAEDVTSLEAARPGEGVAELTRRIEEALRELVPGLDTWGELAFLRDVRALFLGRREESLTEEAVSLRRFIQAYRYYREKDPDTVAAIRERWEMYRRQLRRFSLRDESVDLSEAPVRAARFVLLSAVVILGVMPLAIAGWVTHYPAYRLCGEVERRANRAADQSATFKLIGGILLFPLTYAILAALLAWRGGWKSALVGLALLPLCGWAALRVSEERQRLREGVKALALAFTSRKAVEEIRRQRRGILDSVAQLLRDHPPEAAALR
ncbi:MAG: 1-acyl-sn-glycerol-3-phosphate acyltransferase [Acidobacteria bacterium]|nr:1-acyl-sn-glycerol-3-phosphate acyltransferase [Acidobacteriota bacterium]